jgi:hypothetical protein
MLYYPCCVMRHVGAVLCASRCPPTPLQRAYLTREQCDVAVERMRSGDAAAMGLWVAFEGRGFADFLSFLQPLQVWQPGDCRICAGCLRVSL